MTYVHPDCLFSEESFEVLDELGHWDDPEAFEQKDSFQEYVKAPFEVLLFRTKKNILINQIDKLAGSNYFCGRLDPYVTSYIGCNSYSLNFNFCKKEGEDYSDRFSLYICLDDSYLIVGLSIPDKGQYIDQKNSAKKRFLRNIKNYFWTAECICQNNLNCKNIRFYFHDWVEYVSQSWEYRLNSWLNSPPENAAIDVGLYLEKEEVLKYSELDLIAFIAQTFQRLFPLVLLAISDDPMPAIRDCWKNPIYLLDQLSEDTGFDKAELERWVRAINRKGQAILQGPPGTGKTYMAEKLAQHLIGGGDGFSELVQFHPGYSYEDFIQGIRPQTGQNGQLMYPMVPGRFLEFCKKAESCQGRCVLIIDEINRANLSSVFGELMYLLEYRDREIPLAGSSEPFSIPANVRIIGTMNTADRSIALVDSALRRRFAFISLAPNYEVLRRYHEKNTRFPVDWLIGILKELNKEINDPHYEIGISFFLTYNLADELEDIWRMEIEPYLEEYFFDPRDRAKADKFRWDITATGF